MPIQQRCVPILSKVHLYKKLEISILIRVQKTVFNKFLGINQIYQPFNIYDYWFVLLRNYCKVDLKNSIGDHQLKFFNYPPAPPPLKTKDFFLFTCLY